MNLRGAVLVLGKLDGLPPLGLEVASQSRLDQLLDIGAASWSGTGQLVCGAHNQSLW